MIDNTLVSLVCITATAWAVAAAAATLLNFSLLIVGRDIDNELVSQARLLARATFRLRVPMV